MLETNVRWDGKSEMSVSRVYPGSRLLGLRFWVSPLLNYNTLFREIFQALHLVWELQTSVSYFLPWTWNSWEINPWKQNQL